MPLLGREESARPQCLALVDAPTEELEHHLTGSGFPGAPTRLRALQSEQAVETIPVLRIE